MFTSLDFENQDTKQVTSRIKLFTLIGTYGRIAEVEILLVEFLTKLSFADDLFSLSFFNTILNHCCEEGKSKFDLAFHSSIFCKVLGPPIICPPVRVDFHLHLTFTLNI
jgi:hypothetical protein